jgi:hypothetical protein
MAKIIKKKRARPMIPPSWDTEDRSVPIRTFIEGIVVKLLNGRKSLKVLKPDIFYIDGNCYISEVTTTMKSSQFHESLR